MLHLLHDRQFFCMVKKKETMTVSNRFSVKRCFSSSLVYSSTAMHILLECADLILDNGAFMATASLSDLFLDDVCLNYFALCFFPERDKFNV